MKIVVIVPSLNEEKNISYVTETIDKGLIMISKRFEIEALIINADSGSDDKTRSVFKKTQTFFPKESYLFSGKNKGKGKNIYEALKKYSKKADYFMMFDSDLKSITPIWIKKMFFPLIKNNSDLSIPIYKRNRYEGNTTNHFSSPLIYACFGKYIAQPIAGDFAFSARLANKIVRSVSRESDFGYGIDTLITWTALLNNWNITQVSLDKKIHNPSFLKIIPIFSQVAISTLFLINKNRKKIKKYLGQSPVLFKIKNISENYQKKPLNKQIIETKIKAIEMLPKTKNQNKEINTEKWTDILSQFLRLVLTRKYSDNELISIAKLLTGYYLLRVINYFAEIDNQSRNFIAESLKKQTLLLRKKII